MCGIFAIVNAENASKIAYLGLFALQHRGQESAGISSLANSSIFTHKNLGLVSDVFNDGTLSKLQGNDAIGHVRYSTAGGNIESNIQPISVRIEGLSVSLVHNGNIVNADEIRNELEKSGAILQGTADTEIILHLIARSTKATFVEKLQHTLSRLVGAFSLLILTPTPLYAVVDTLAYRPLSLGKRPLENGKPSFVLASETCAMDLVDAEFIRDIRPGEIFSIDLQSGKTQSYQFERGQDLGRMYEFDSAEDICEKTEAHIQICNEVFSQVDEGSAKLIHSSPQQTRCVFEHVYFSRPDSLVWGILAHDARFEMGVQLAASNPIDADMVIAIPDSGVPMAMGYASASGIPYKIGLIRNHYVGRTFIEPTQNIRNFRVRLKLNPIRGLVRGKSIIVIDDSIVRGTTSRKIIEILREAGAKEVHMRISSPPVKYPCFYGIDTPERKELLAQQMTVDEMNVSLKADSLAFLSQDQLLNVMERFSRANDDKPTQLTKLSWCMACFSGKYQDQESQKKGNDYE